MMETPKTHVGALKLLSPAERADYNILGHLDREERLRAIKRADLIGWQPDPNEVKAKRAAYLAKRRAAIRAATNPLPVEGLTGASDVTSPTASAATTPAASVVGGL